MGLEYRFFINGHKLKLISEEYYFIKDNDFIGFQNREGKRTALDINKHFTNIISKKHFRLLHKEDGWYVIDLGSTNGTWVSVNNSNWMRLTPNKEYGPLRFEDLFSIGQPEYELFFGFKNKNIFDILHKIQIWFTTNKTAKGKIVEILKELEKIELDFERNHWQSLWWWDKQEKRDIYKLKEILEFLDGRGLTSDEYVNYLSIAVKKIVYAQAHHDYNLMPNVSCQNLEEAVKKVHDLLVNDSDKLEIEPVKKNLKIKSPLYDKELLKRELIESIKFALKNKYGRETHEQEISKHEVYDDFYNEYSTAPDPVHSESIEKGIEYLKSEESKRKLSIKENGSWVYYTFKDGNKPILHRYYFNVRTDRFDDFIHILLQNIIYKLNLIQNEITFKHSRGGLSHERKDRLVLYSSFDISKIIKDEMSRYPGLFNPDKPSFTSEICKGVFYAPEPLSTKFGNAKTHINFSFERNKLMCSPDIEKIRINGRLIRQVINNLIENFDIIYMKKSNESYKIQIDYTNEKFRFSKDGEKFSDIWFHELSIKGGDSSISRIINYHPVLSSFGDEFDRAISGIWAENPKRSPEEIADEVLKYFSENYKNMNFNN